jgi:hypothetical protein
MVTIVLISLIIYPCLGYIIGFSLTAHKDILNGVRPNSQNKVVLFLARPTSEIKGIEKLIFIVGILIWTVSFFLLATLPVILAEKFSLEISEYAGYAIIPLMIVGKLAGDKAWKTIPKRTG